MEMLKAAARAGLKLFKWLLIVVVVAIAAVFAINAFDETLKPEAAAALRWPETSVKDADNGYFALVGLSAPAGQDGPAWGRRWVEEMNRARTRAEVEAAEKAVATAPLKFAGSPAALCDFRADQPCAPQAAKRVGDIDKLAADNAELLGRYAAIRAFPKVAEIYRPQSMSHPIVGVFIYNNAQRLVLSQHLANLERDAGAPALAALAGDIDQQRRVLAGAASLILKMTANAALARDYLALNELVRRHPGMAGAQGEALQRILVPLTREELALAPAMMSEFRAMAAVLDDPAIADPATYQLMQMIGDASDIMPADGGTETAFVPTSVRQAPVVLKASALDGILAPVLKGTTAVLLQKNATRNRQYEFLHAVAALDEVPGPRLGEAEQQLAAQPDEGMTWSWVYNPIGKLILSVAIPSFSNHKRRLLDTEGLRRLVALQQRIAAGGIADADIPAFLAKAERSLTDPYTDQPMRWDAEKRALYFATAKNSRWFVVGKDGRIAVGI